MVGGNIGHFFFQFLSYFEIGCEIPGVQVISGNSTSKNEKQGACKWHKLRSAG